MVVVCPNTNVKVFREDNTLAFEFPTVPPSEVGKTEVDLYSVAVKKDGTILVGDTTRKVLTEHSPTDGSLLRTIPVEIKPRFLAVHSKGRLVISGWSKGVRVTDGSGATLFSIKPTIGGQPVKSCRGVYTDSSGIYIAVCNEEGTGHIHHYDAGGGFLTCIAQGLCSPQGLTMTADGQLAVADRVLIRIYDKM